MSRHLDEIINRHNSVANLQIVFVDIEKYSQRRTQNQVAVVRRFTEDATRALDGVSAEYVKYAQDNDLNMNTDIIRLPTGDGACVVFSFDGLHDIHLKFALALLREVHAGNEATPCAKFAEHGWCNCHTNYYLRTGISEGRGVVFRDMNNAYNAAGTALNTAARVMGNADRQQILFTDAAHGQIVDLVDDPALADRFREFGDVRIKHGLRVSLHQYVGDGEPGLNSDPPAQLTATQNFEGAVKDLFGMVPAIDLTNAAEDPEEVVKFLDGVIDVVRIQQSALERGARQRLRAEADAPLIDERPDARGPKAKPHESD